MRFKEIEKLKAMRNKLAKEQKKLKHNKTSSIDGLRRRSQSEVSANAKMLTLLEVVLLQHNKLKKLYYKCEGVV